ncbi:ABC transporter permease [Macrococcus hajekii]|uniref:ABC transporter permease n=1 Tax=Macrococcus hajekii TaxID=198482 RepID=A0A4R6BJ67_9STAP|nr:ABC transporter permease subunit [Macrococcus hajekii]TDM01739.1 ABC transporter permease [Macrococcus hajekii]GGB06987.1 membrane protein [Macrococcus hajekii]
MKILMVMLRKEWMECLRTYKVVSVLAIMVFIAIMSPLTALMMPDIIKNSLPDLADKVTIPEATYFHSYTQFFKNMNQIGLILMILIFGGTLTAEFSKGTLLILLTKGLSRKYVVLSKWLMAVLLWSMAYIFSIVVHYMYTNYYFEPLGQQRWISYGMVWQFGVVLLSVIILASVVTKSYMGVLISILVLVVGLFLLNLNQHIADYSPLYLIQNNMNMITGEIHITDIYQAVIVSVTVIITSITSSIIVFNKSSI